MARALLFFLLLPAAFAQSPLLINNAALRFTSQTTARVAPRSLVQVRVDTRGFLLGDPSIWPPLDLNESVTLTIQPDGSEALPVDVLEATSFDVLTALPADLPLGPATMTLTYNGGTMSSATVEVVRASFALFTDNSLTGPALAQNVNPGSPIEFNALTRPARPGGYVTLWGTGLGHAVQQDVSILLDGRPVPVQYAGPSPTLDGLDQINIFVPFDAEISDGCYVPLRVSVFGEVGNAVSISKTGEQGPCIHPLGLSEQQMQRLDEGGSVPIGRLGIYSSIGPPPAILSSPVVDTNALTRVEQAEASFFSSDRAGVARWSQTLAPASEGCRLNRSALFGPAGFIVVGGGVNVGHPVSVAGPDTLSLDLQATLGFGYHSSSLDPAPYVDDPADLPPPFFVGGEWEFIAPGSFEAEAFRVALRLPPPVEVTNFQDLKTVDRAAGVTITWRADGYTESDTMLVQLPGRRDAALNYEPEGGPPTIACAVAAREGQITIEPQLLQELEPTEPGLPTLLTLSVNGPADDESHFTLKLATGETVPGVISYGLSESLPIELR